MPEAPAPKTGVSTNSTTLAIIKTDIIRHSNEP